MSLNQKKEEYILYFLSFNPLFHNLAGNMSTNIQTFGRWLFEEPTIDILIHSIYMLWIFIFIRHHIR